MLNSATDPRRPDGSAFGGHVSVRNVVKRYGALEVVRDISIDIVPGEFLALLGPSGSGKTTLLTMIAGFETPSDGAVYINGTDVSYLPPHRRDLGMVFQRYALFPHMSIAENVAFPLKMRGLPKSERAQRVDETLSIVGLAGYGSRMPSQLSGGQQQRVALARAIVYRPPVLLMDEPLGALDKNLRERMQIEIKQLQVSLGATVIYVTHDQEEALTMADRIAVLNAGKIEQIGRPEDLYHKPANDFVAGFLGETNLFGGEVVEVTSDGCRVRLKDGSIVSAGHGGRAISAGEPVRISVRPENVRISDHGIAAGIDNVIFAGATVIVLARTSADQKITARLPSSDATGRPKAGDRIFLDWRASAATVL